MRSEKEMMDMILGYAKEDDRVRVVGMNGSRTNPNAPLDKFQDYDVVYVVTEMKSFLDDHSWIDVFGRRIILQTPESMTMFPPELGNWFSYLMLFEDGSRIDMILVPLEELDKYIKDDKLIKILMDKDGRVPPLPPASDKDYWVKKPSAEFFDDCCNEFWWLSTYVAKGLCRSELSYAVHHLNMMRNLLFTMLSWEVGIDIDFSKSMGKQYKYLSSHISQDRWDMVMRTYKNHEKNHIWKALKLSCHLFRVSSVKVSTSLKFQYPNYDEKVTSYLEKLYK